MDLTSAVRRSSESPLDQADRHGGAVRQPPIAAEALDAFEVRWFVPGARPSRLWRPDRRPRTRLDTYHDQTLGRTFSLKRRGKSGPWERKHCVEHTHVVVFGDAAVAERWTKEPPQQAVAPAGSWTAVSKRIWRRAGFEVVDVRLDNQRWWSVALKLRPSSFPSDAVEALVSRAASEGFSGSYPAWLIEHAVTGQPSHPPADDACPATKSGRTHR